MTLSFALTPAIVELYNTFASYPLPGWTDPCMHCHSSEDEARLHRAPLNQLTIEDLENYAVDALSVWGDENVFRHFLPRIFELYAEHSGAFLIDPEMIFNKLRYAHWLRWPDTEQAAVRRYLMSLWHAVITGELRNTDPNVDVEDWLCAIAQAEDNLEPYLAIWIAPSDDPRAASLSEFILSSAITLPTDTERNPFWKDRDTQFLQVKLWIMSDSVSNYLAAAEVKSEEEYAELIKQARQMITS